MISQKTKTILSIFLTTFLFAFLCVGLAHAQYLGFDQGEAVGLPEQDARVIAMYIIKNILGVLGIIFIIITLYAGFLWMTAGGNTEQIKKAKQWMVNSIIGMALVLSSWVITDYFITRVIGRAMQENYQEGGIQDQCYNWNGTTCD